MTLEPLVDKTSQEFWDSAKAGRLVVQRCSDCGTYCHPPRIDCTACGSSRTQFVEMSGRGRVHSMSLTEHAFLATELRTPPYFVFIVELEEQRGLLMAGSCGPEDPAPAIGSEVIVSFQPQGNFQVPNFTPVPGGTGNRNRRTAGGE